MLLYHEVSHMWYQVDIDIVNGDIMWELVILSFIIKQVNRHTINIKLYHKVNHMWYQVDIDIVNGHIINTELVTFYAFLYQKVLLFDVKPI